MPLILGLGAAGLPGVPTEVTYRPGSEYDAATMVVWATWRNTPSSGDYIYVLDPSGRDMNTSLRFTGVAIPKNAPIISAKLTLYANGKYTGSDAGQIVKVGLEQVDNASQITTYSAHDTRRSNVGSEISWLLGDTSARNDPWESPELKSIVQPIVNRSGWASGNAMQFFLQTNNSTPSSWNTEPQAQSYENNTSSSYRPMLKITYLASA